MESPCQDCPYRKVYCHDRCGEYLDWHDELVRAKEELKKTRAVNEFLFDSLMRMRKTKRVKK